MPLSSTATWYTTPFSLNKTPVRFGYPIYSYEAQSTSKLIIILDWKLKRANSRVTEESLNTQNLQGSRIKSSVVFRYPRVIVNLLLRSTVT